MNRHIIPPWRNHICFEKIKWIKKTKPWEEGYVFLRMKKQGLH